MLGFVTNNANAQKVIGIQTRTWTFSPDQQSPVNGIFQIPCLTEVISGLVIEYQYFTNNTYHVLARGFLNGKRPVITR